MCVPIGVVRPALLTALRDLGGGARFVVVRALWLRGETALETLPKIAIDPERYTVTIDGERIAPRPAAVLPLAQRYFLF